MTETRTAIEKFSVIVWKNPLVRKELEEYCTWHKSHPQTSTPRSYDNPEHIRSVLNKSKPKPLDNTRFVKRGIVECKIGVDGGFAEISKLCDELGDSIRHSGKPDFHDNWWAISVTEQIKQRHLNLSLFPRVVQVKIAPVVEGRKYSFEFDESKEVVLEKPLIGPASHVMDYDVVEQKLVLHEVPKSRRQVEKQTTMNVFLENPIIDSLHDLRMRNYTEGLDVAMKTYLKDEKNIESKQGLEKILIKSSQLSADMMSASSRAALKKTSDELVKMSNKIAKRKIAMRKAQNGEKMVVFDDADLIDAVVNSEAVKLRLIALSGFVDIDTEYEGQTLLSVTCRIICENRKFVSNSFLSDIAVKNSRPQQASILDRIVKFFAKVVSRLRFPSSKVHPETEPEDVYDESRNRSIAATKHHVNIMELLMQYGADVNWGGTEQIPPLHVCAMHDLYDVVSILVKGGSRLDILDGSGRSALITAAIHGNVRTMKALLDLGAELNWKDAINKSALHHCAQKGHTLACLFLMRCGSPKAARDCSGVSAGEAALQNGWKETANRIMAFSEVKEDAEVSIRYLHDRESGIVTDPTQSAFLKKREKKKKEPNSLMEATSLSSFARILWRKMSSMRS